LNAKSGIPKHSAIWNFETECASKNDAGLEIVVGWVETICFDFGFRPSTQPAPIIG
jgi:hypothetical protein